MIREIQWIQSLNTIMRMKLKLGSLVLCVSLYSCSSIFAVAPNFVIILADDLGYGDVQCYNRESGKIATPNIDKLALQGMRFTDAHTSSGVCSPTRYALLTGRYHWRTRLQSGIVEHLGRPLIAPDRLTIGSLAQQHGYRTAAIGKWHLGWNWNIQSEQMHLFAPGRAVSPPVTDAHREAWKATFSKPISEGPTTRGFNEYFGTDVPNQSPYCFIENDRTIGIPTVFLPLPLLKGQLAGIAGPANPDWKLEGILPALGDRAVDFIARQSRAKQPFLLYLPLTSPHTPIAVNREWQGRSGLGDYADFVMETDAVVGQVLAALESHDLTNQTFVLFTSDNGCASHAYREMKSHGHLSSGPLREFKGSVYEGGHRVPFIVRWPSMVEPGSVCEQIVHQVDTLATVADILDSKLLENAGEDSISFRPLLEDPSKPVRLHSISTAGSGIPSLRLGPWKLVVTSGGSQLYNLEDDIGESVDLAASMPERVSAMSKQLEKFIADGRSTPGTLQKNDVEVIRYPKQR